MSIPTIPTTDDAKRMVHAMRFHMTLRHFGKWASFKLEDGSSNGIAYDRRREAIRDRWPWEDNYFYIKVLHDAFTEETAQRLLNMHRAMRKAGVQMTDPESDLEPILPDTIEETIALTNRLLML